MEVGHLVLVTGATGQQGGAVARSLLQRGSAVRALTRDAEKPAAKQLVSLGAEVVEGDLEDRASLERALEGVSGVFSAQQFYEAGYEGEVRQGKGLADAAKAAGVGHFVYSSVGSAHRDTGIPHFESKWEVEEHVREIGLPYTVLRPVFFMQNWGMMSDMVLGGTLAQPLDPAKPLQQVAVEDIGAFAALAFENPDAWIGREVDLAGDERTMPEIAAAFSEVTGREVNYHQASWDQFEEQMGEEFTVMYRWFDDVGYDADIPALKSEYPQLTTFDQFLRGHGWADAKPSSGS